MKEIEAIVASPTEQDNLVVQLFKRDGGQFGEVFREGIQSRIEIYPSVDGKPWNFEVDELVHVLQLAVQKLSATA